MSASRGTVAAGLSIGQDVGAESCPIGDRPVKAAAPAAGVPAADQGALGSPEWSLRTLMGNLPGMVYRCAMDRQWTMEYVSAGAEELTGYRPEDLLGNARLAYADLIAPWHCEAVCRDIQAAVEEGDAWTISYPIITAGGARKWVWERGVAVRDATGEVRALEGLIVDMTAEHDAEEQLEVALAEWRQTFDAISDAVVLTDARGVVLRANAAAATFAERDHESMMGQTCCTVFRGGATLHPDCPRQRALRSGHLETSFVTHGERRLRVTYQPLRGAGAGEHGGVHVFSDVSDLGQGRHKLAGSVARRRRAPRG